MSGIGHSDTDFHDFYDLLVVRHDFFMIFQGFHRNGIIFGHILQSSFFLVSPVIRFLQLLRLNSQWFVEWTRSCSENQLKSMESVVHAFSFISNTFISNTRLRFAYFETRISENNEIWTMRLFQNDCTHSK